MGKRTRRFAVLSVLVVAGWLCAGVAAAVAQSINVGTGNGSAGGTATFAVTLSSGTATVAGTMNDIGFDPHTPIAVASGGRCLITTTTTCTTDANCPPLPSPYTGNEPCVIRTGQPDCTVNSAINKQAFFSFQPTSGSPVAAAAAGASTLTLKSAAPAGFPLSGLVTQIGLTSLQPAIAYTLGADNVTLTLASALPSGVVVADGAIVTVTCSGTSCTGIRALVFAVNTQDLTAIPDASTLYTCNVNIAAGTADGDYALTISNVNMGDTSHNPVAGATGNPGKITVGAAQPFLVCDVAPSTGSGVGQFGDGHIRNNDVVAIFLASLLTPPPAGSALFSAMDSAPTDNPPTCGGDGHIRNNDVVACFKLSLLGGTTYDRTISPGGACTSAAK